MLTQASDKRKASEMLAMSCRPNPRDQDKDAKRQRPTNPRDKEEADKSGDIIVADNQFLVLPVITGKEDPCGAYYKHGVHCWKSGKKGCHKCHTPIDKLSLASKKLWFAHVNATPILSFNPDTVKSFTSSTGGVKPP